MLYSRDPFGKRHLGCHQTKPSIIPARWNIRERDDTKRGGPSRSILHFAHIHIQPAQRETHIYTHIDNELIGWRIPILKRFAVDEMVGRLSCRASP